MMQSLQFSVGMFSLLLLGGVVLACLVVLVRGLRLPRRFPRRAACGACGYEIAFTSPRCTECGHDLRITGTLTAHTALRLRSNPIIMMIAWTILNGLALTGVIALYMSLPSMAATYVTSGNTRARFSPMRRFLTRADEASSQLPNYNLMLNGNYTGSEWDSLTLRFVPDIGPRLLVSFDSANRSWTLEGSGDPIQGSGVDIDSVQQYYEAAQIDVANEVIQIEIDQLASILDQALSTPSTLGSNNLQIHDPRNTDEPARYTPQPELRVLEDMGGSYSSDGRSATETNEYLIGGNFGKDGRFAVTIEYDRDEDGRPAHMKSLDILLPAEIGWPIEIRCDLDADTWRAVRNEETLYEAAHPATEEDAKIVLREMKDDLVAPLSDALALDVADLINLTDDDLIGFTGWRPPRRAEQYLVGGLQHNGGGSGSSMQSVQPPYGVLYYLMWVGFLVAWIGGGWFMIARRRRLITPPTDA